MSKTGFSTYVNERFSGFDGRSEFQADDVADSPTWRCGCSTRRRWRIWCSPTASARRS